MTDQNDQPLRPLLVLALAPLAGALVTASLAPYDVWPAGIASCALYAYLLCSCTVRAAVWRGWLFGLGLFGSGASWVYVSIHVYGYASVPLALFLTFLFCAGLALLHALFAWCYVRYIRALPGGMLLGFGALWVLFEWLRSWLLTGFPWLYLGYGHIDTPISGWAPLVGVYGLSLICAISGSCLFLAWRSRRIMHLLSYTAIVAAMWLGGAALKPTEWVAPASDKTLQVALVQANIPQQYKWDRDWYQPILGRYRDAMEPLYGYDIVVWPESAIPRIYQRAQDFLGPIAARASATNTALITGIPYRADGSEIYYASIVALGQGSGVYHKQRLVPFGEYVPMESLLRGLIAFFDLPMSAFTPGPPGQDNLRVQGFRVAPFICYEVVYPDLVAAGARQAELLVTISNDSWFGRSIGPIQHLQMARMRALENGRYMIRGTNNGISALIDHRGKIIAQSAQFEATTLTGEVQVMLGTTPYSSFGSMPIIAGCFIALFLMALMYAIFWRRG